MASARFRRLRNQLFSLALLCSGLWLAGSATWQLVRTAMFVHESVVVTGTVFDVIQRPFESWEETLGQGNWSMPGDVSYQPYVRFMLPGGIEAKRLDFAPDNVDYRVGEEISIISPPSQPARAMIHRGKFLWGASCLRLGIGITLTLTGYGLLRWQRGKRPARPAAEDSPAPARRRSGGKAEKSSATEKPKRTRQRKTEADGAAPRRRRKAEPSPAEGEAPKPKRKPRSPKKKAEPVQGEFPF